ncbi:MAG TPA: carbohydrate ABC transporter permease [Armatimonadota bacterium]|jgi:multiple sugar transport system permease protein
MQATIQPSKRGARRDALIANGIAYALLLIGAALFILPFLFMVSTSLKSVDEANEFPPTLVPHKPILVTVQGKAYPEGRLPDGRAVAILGIVGEQTKVIPLTGAGAPALSGARLVKPTDVAPVRRIGAHVENFHNSVSRPGMPFGLFLENTLLIVALTVLGATLSAALCAYGFARLRFRGREPLFIMLLATMMIPGQVTMIPVYIMFKQLHWINTFLPLIVPAWFGGGAFSIFLLRQFFQGIPFEMEEAARIDGCGPLSTWWRIILPLSIPALATIAIFTFMASWNDFMGPLIYINDTNKFTLALGLNLFKGQYGTDTPHLMMAATLLVLMPVLILFFVAQKQFIQGIVVSGVKG